MGLEPKSKTLFMKNMIANCLLDIRSPDSCESDASMTPLATSFGRSLLADVSKHYMSDFVLQGAHDVKDHKLHSDLTHSLQHSVLDEKICESVCIVADTDQWYIFLHFYPAMLSLYLKCISPILSSGT